MTSIYGIFVIETKHYEGWIFGKEDQKYWTQVIYKRKEKLYNPIWQNNTHIKSLKNYLNLEDNFSFYSIIAFSNNSTLKFEDNFKNARVVQFNGLLNSINNQSNQVFDFTVIETFNNTLEQLKNLDRSEKKKIKKTHTETKNMKIGIGPFIICTILFYPSDFYLFFLVV